jgi:hypothetical protein
MAPLPFLRFDMTFSSGPVIADAAALALVGTSMLRSTAPRLSGT